MTECIHFIFDLSWFPLGFGYMTTFMAAIISLQRLGTETSSGKEFYIKLSRKMQDKIFCFCFSSLKDTLFSEQEKG